MKHLRGVMVVVWLTCALTAAAWAAPASPASAMPRACFAYAEANKELVQAALSVAAVPPVVGLFAPGVTSPLGYVNGALGLPEGMAEDAAPHVTGVALGMSGQGTVIVVAFDEDRWPKLLLKDARKRGHGMVTLADGKMAGAARGNCLLLGAPADAWTDLAARDFEALTADSVFPRAREAAGAAQGGQDVPLWGYCDLARARRLLTDPMPPEEAAEFARVNAAIGLDRADMALLSLREDGERSVLDLTLSFDGPDAWLLRLVPQTRANVAGHVSGDAAAVLMLNWGDARTFVGDLREMLFRLADAKGLPYVRGFFPLIEARLGLSLDALLAPIGSGAAIYYPAAAPNSVMRSQDWTAVILAKDATGFGQMLNRVSIALAGRPPERVGRAGVESWRMPDLPVYYRMLDDRVVLGGSNDALERHSLSLLRSDVPTFRTTIGERQAAVLFWADLGRLMRGYPPGGPGAKLVAALSREQEKIRLTVSLEGADGSTMGRGVALHGIVAAMAMPALARARAEAQVAVSKSNLHNIGIAVVMYQMEHAGMPASLDDLLPQNYLDSPDIFVAPGDEAPLSTPGGLSTSYLYVGALPGGVPPDVIIAYSRKGLYKNVRAMLNADGTVLTADEVNVHDASGTSRTSLRASYDALIAALGNRLTEQRKAELRRFYEVEE